MQGLGSGSRGGTPGDAAWLDDPKRSEGAHRDDASSNYNIIKSIIIYIFIYRLPRSLLLIYSLSICFSLNLSIVSQLFSVLG